MAKVKVFVYTANADADADSRALTLILLPAHWSRLAKKIISNRPTLIFFSMWQELHIFFA